MPKIRKIRETDLSRMEEIVGKNYGLGFIDKVRRELDLAMKNPDLITYLIAEID